MTNFSFSSLSNISSTHGRSEFRFAMEESFSQTNLTLEQMTENSWTAEYGENLEASVWSNLT